MEAYDQPAEIDSAAAVANDDEHTTSVREAFQKYPNAVVWAIVMSFTIVMEGYDTFLMGSLMAYPAFVHKYGQYYPELNEYAISGTWQVALGTAATCGSVIGLLINGYVTEKFGHRIVTMCGLVIMSGFIFITFLAPSVQVLLVGQVLIGIPWGIFAIMGSAYSSEVCPLALRGYLTSFVNICWVIGQLIAAGLLQGLVNITTEWSYKIPFAVQWAWPLPLFILAWLAPDSPWWLVRRGRLELAEKSLTRLAPGLTTEQVHQKVLMMYHTNKLEQTMQTEVSFWDAFKGTNLRRTEIACIVLSSQNLLGQVLAYNATYFFTQAGLSASNAYKLNFGSTGLAFAATCFSWLLMTFFGRRTLMLWGMCLLTLDLFLIGILSYASDLDKAMWAQSALAVIWLGIYSSTIGPQSFALAAEVSATRLRSQTISIARNSYNVVSIITNTVEPYLINPTEANLKGKTALVWFGVSVLTTAWGFYRMPETRGRTYAELDVLFEKRIPAWKLSSMQMDVIAEADVIQGRGEKSGEVAEVEHREN